MEEKSDFRSFLKRLLDEEDSKKKKQKRVMFPKGKKQKTGLEEAAGGDGDGFGDFINPRLAAMERFRHRNPTISMLRDVSAAEVAYKDDDVLIEDGIEIEPFNLKREREEGFFDEDDNFRPYLNDEGTKDGDAWVDSVEANTKYTGKTCDASNNDEAAALSSDDIGMMKRRIANVLEPGETVLQALRRLKGGSNNRKEKMSAETKREFDQLTEDAMKLMENGELNVYHEKQEVFRREAERYEKLALAKGKKRKRSLFAGTSSSNQTSSEVGDVHNDYVYDESSGYYYSSSLGYYYDPTTELYCSATSGQWYSFNEATGTYDEVQ